MRFKIFKATGGGFFWKIVAANGETLAHSEVYTAKASAQHAISVVKANAASAPEDDLT